jgi:hypothetical protein
MNVCGYRTKEYNKEMGTININLNHVLFIETEHAKVSPFCGSVLKIRVSPLSRIISSSNFISRGN